VPSTRTKTRLLVEEYARLTGGVRASGQGGASVFERSDGLYFVVLQHVRHFQTKKVRCTSQEYS
jgi:hypothetical protein